MTDGMGREIDYLRISVTDRCNLRCRYCMPEEGVPLMKHEDILTFQEIERICAAAARLGIRKLKITGGEPLVRRDIASLVAALSKIPGIEDVTMTSNGSLLAETAEQLFRAGLSSVNVSLDTLDPVRFAEITRRNCFDQVMEGIGAAVEAGLRVKINCAVMQEATQEEVLDFAEFSRSRRIPVRFIEMMPIGQGREFQTVDNIVLLEMLRAEYPDFEQVTGPGGNGPAVYYGFARGEGCIGIISAVHRQFCRRCNRVRLQSNGYLKLCLDREEGADLRTPLRAGIQDTELEKLLERAIRRKPECHRFGQGGEENKNHLNMNEIGG